MAQINVADLLADPDFIDPMSIVKRKTSVNSKGENVLNEICVETYGSIQPASGKTIQRLPEAFRVANVSSFWVKGEITVSGPGIYSDVLVFHGKRYQVQLVFDWMNWGEGWCEGTCVAEVPA